MPTSEERLRVLQLIQNGKITAEEGIRLLGEFGFRPHRLLLKILAEQQLLAVMERAGFGVRVTDTNWERPG